MLADGSEYRGDYDLDVAGLREFHRPRLDVLASTVGEGADVLAFETIPCLAEVEAVLDAHPDVVESAVFGVPDAEWGQRVVAAYVGAADPRELGAWARERLAPAKRPKALHALAELPRTSTGKVRRLDLPGVLGLPGG